ncbi:MAG TPA: nucleotidyltransferase domain-containing protein [candidate division Zixibacteria bacterium]|nr:nucleotidyltransferase domain-containing protein [candidate division Zixibacteria bacterium]
MPKIQPLNPIEGFFIQSQDGLIFDVKGLSHPSDRIIAFVRYIPENFFTGDMKESRKGYQKIYDLNSRYTFLKENFPNYIFKDTRGRGLLQGVRVNQISKIFDPRVRLQEILNLSNRNLLEEQVSNLTSIILDYSKIDKDAIGISGSILVGLHTEESDIDIVIYGKKNGQKLYKNMPIIYEKVLGISKYTEKDLEELWKRRGQTEQIDFSSFCILEKKKLLQGKYNGIDFYIRLVPLPEEFQEDYLNTNLTYLGEIEIEAIISDAKDAIFTPCLYQLTEVKIIKSTSMGFIKPKRFFSVRGRYCELVTEGENICLKGKLEQVIIKKDSFYQITLGTTKDEFFKLK